MYCKKCGKEIDNEAVVCIHCGVATHDQPVFQQPQYQPTQYQQPQYPQYQYQQPQYQQPPYQAPIINVVNTNTNVNTGTTMGGPVGYVYKNKWTAFFLCLFLGALGIHRFYVGKIGTGILWAFTGGCFYIGWIIDLVLILCDSFRDKAGMPLTK